MVRSQYPL